MSSLGVIGSVVISEIGIPLAKYAIEHLGKYIETYLKEQPQSAAHEMASTFQLRVENAHLEDPHVQEKIEKASSFRSYEQGKIETLAVEAAKDFFHKNYDIELFELGGRGLVDTVGVDTKTNQLVFVECKGTGLEQKQFNQLGLRNDLRTENSPEWLDKQQSSLLRGLDRLSEGASPETQASLTSIREKVVETLNDGGFEMNQHTYRSGLFIVAKKGAMDVFSTEAQKTLGQWQKETGSTLVILDEAPSQLFHKITQKSTLSI